jgi:hypothetical protein
MIDYSKIKFVADPGDGVHCFQAVMAMVLSYLEPEKKFSFEELDIISGKESRLWSWPIEMFSWLVDDGYQVREYSLFDSSKFVENPDQYILERYGQEMGQAQVDYSNLPRVAGAMKKMMHKEPVKFFNQAPTIDDIKSLLEKDYLVVVNVNAKSLRNKEGYSGHFVLVLDIDKENVTFHDPGIYNSVAGIENDQVSIEQFTKGWMYPTKEDSYMFGVK